MKSLVFGLLALCLAHSSWATDFPKENGVFILGDNNFEEFVTANNYVLAEFYAPWCGHCKALEPEYADAALGLEKEGSPVKLAKIDATEHAKLAEKYGVEGYPTLKWFKGGKPVEYNGPRKTAGIMQWVKKRSGPAAATVKTTSEMDKLAKKEVVVVGVFSDLESKAAKNFIHHAEGNDDVEFAVTDSEEVRKHLQVGNEDTVVLLKQYDEGRNVYTGKMSVEGIEEFVSANWLPLVMEFSEATQGKIFGGDVETHMLFLVKFSSELYEGRLSCFAEAGKGLRGKIMFVTIDTEKDDNQNLLSFFNIDDPSQARVIILNTSNNQGMVKYLYDGEITCDSFKQFADDYLAGKAKPFYASEDVPEDWDAKPNKVLVGKNFHDVAFDKNKHVFVKFYAPWCGHCKSMAKDWEKLAEYFEKDADVVIAELEATKNEVPEVPIEGFPTIKMFPKAKEGADQEILEYGGGRTYQNMKQYVEAIKRGERPNPTHDADHAEEESMEEEGGEEGAEEEEEEEEKEKLSFEGEENEWVHEKDEL
eukprot:comp12538_c0_seq1/m.7527 comp12538_c0_seq1/g.7527  ORF comp12538_c0_seq1/g.7527 comp12538_c0_seq1/m.7527 type:complete len:534 (-) comp12538_c0_seq1:551-2152(-)